MALFNRRKPGTEALDCSGHQASIEVKGEASYQRALERIAGPKTEDGGAPDVVALLKPDPSNEYDSNAVQVLVSGLLVGFVNREDAPWVQQAVIRLERAEGRPVAVKGRLVGGWDRGSGDEGSWGIWLWYDPALLA